MKKTLLAAIAGLLLAAPARAGLYYDLQQGTSAFMRLSGNLKITDPAAPMVPTITLDGAKGVTLASPSTFTVAGLDSNNDSAHLYGNLLLENTFSLHWQASGARIQGGTSNMNVNAASGANAVLVNNGAAGAAGTRGLYIYDGNLSPALKMRFDPTTDSAIATNLRVGDTASPGAVIDAAGSGNTTYSLKASTGIQVSGSGASAGGVTAAWFNGTYYGDGSKLTGLLPGAGAITAQGTPTAGQVVVFQAGGGSPVVSTGPITVAFGPGVSTTTFSGVVRISTGFTVNFNASAFTVNQTALNTSATVTGSTGSFTVQGSTVACWLSGNAEGAASGNGVLATLTVDGSATTVPGTSATVGWTSCTSGASSPFICAIGAGSYREFQVTPGRSHTFVLFMWMLSSTATWPGAHNVGQFGCREVPSM